MPRQVRRVSLLLTLLVLTGCVANLPAVREYAKSTLAVSHTFTDIANDIPQSCMRRVNVVSTSKKIVVVTLPDNRKQVQYADDYQRRLETCQALQDSLTGILAVNTVLQGYAEALGKLASNEVVTFTTELKDLEKALKGAEINGKKPFDSSKAKAISGLAQLVFNTATEGYRQKELRNTITLAEPHLHVLIQGLVDIVQDYQVLLESEHRTLRRAQAKLIGAFEGGSQDDVIAERLLENMARKATLEAKQDYATSYIATLHNIAKTHTALYTNKTKLTSKELFALVKEYASEVGPVLNKFRKAFLTQQLSFAH